MKKFMLCADDYGMSAGVSKAIIGLVNKQRLSAIGCMTNMRGWQNYARELTGLNHIDIGLHLNLTASQPLGVLIKNALTRRLNSQNIEQEIEHQCLSFEDAMGRTPDFIDGHQHVHALPIIRQALVRVIQKRNYNNKPWLRDPCDSIAAIMHRGVCVKKALIVKALGHGLAKLAHKAGIKTNHGFSGFSAFNTTHDYATDFKRFLVNMGDKHLIMCHPGFIDDELRETDSVVETRPLEYDFFMNSQFDDICAAHNLLLCRYKELI